MPQHNKELLKISDNITELALEIDNIEYMKKRVAPLREEITSLSKVYRAGFEERTVTCKVLFNDPEPGKKTIIREDTTDIISTEEMTAEEMQEEMKFAKDTSHTKAKSQNMELDLSEFGKVIQNI